MARRFALLIGTLFLFVLVASVTAASPWTVTITDPQGDVRVYTVNADTEAHALNLGWYRFKQDSTATAVPGQPPPTGGYPSIASYDFDGDFDSGCQTVGGQGGWSSTVGANTSNPTIDRSRVGEGNCSGRFVSSGGSGSRAELSSATLPTGTEVIYEFLVYFPASYSHVGFINQTKMNNNPCANGGVAMGDRFSPVHVEMVIRSHCDADNTRIDLGAAPRDRWFAVKVHFKHSDTGFAQVWIDPDGPGPAAYDVRLPRTNLDTRSGDQLKLRFGSYGNGSSGTTIWLDGFRRDCLNAC